MILLETVSLQEVDRTPDLSPASAPLVVAATVAGSSAGGPHGDGNLQLTVEKLKHRTALAIRELHQAQQELWALRGAAPAGHSPTDLEQDLITLKKRVNFPLDFF